MRRLSEQASVFQGPQGSEYTLPSTHRQEGRPGFGDPGFLFTWPSKSFAPVILLLVLWFPCTPLPTGVSELTLCTAPTGVRTLKTLSELRGEWQRQQEPWRNPHFSLFKGGQLCTSKTALLPFLSSQTCWLPPFKGRLSPGIRSNATGIQGGSAQQPGPLRLCQRFQREHGRLSSPSVDWVVLGRGKGGVPSFLCQRPLAPGRRAPTYKNWGGRS